MPHGRGGPQRDGQATGASRPEPPARRRDVTEETAARQAAQQGAGPSPGAVAADREARDRVRVSMPAEGAYLSVLRTATAGLAARLEFTLDEIDDVGISAVQSCALH